MIHFIITAILIFLSLSPDLCVAREAPLYSATTESSPRPISTDLDLINLLVPNKEYHSPEIGALAFSGEGFYLAQADQQDIESGLTAGAEEQGRAELEKEQAPTGSMLPDEAENKSSEEKSKPEAKISGDVFGRKKILFHPYISFKQEYSDNIYNSGSNVQGDAISTLSPGVWFAFPSSKERLLEVSTSSLTPGGLLLSREKARFPRKYQAYVFLGGDYERYASNPDENADNYKFEAVMQYNLKSGISADLVNQFVTSQDARGSGISTELDKYSTNLTSLLLSYDISDDFNVRADFSNYFVDYEAERNETRDRMDNSFSGYLFYKFKPKTSLFAEYEFIDISYNSSPLRDSSENNFYTGIRMDLTGKTSGELKAGYGIKDFADPETKGVDKFRLELKAVHAFSSKNLLKLAALRKVNETSVSSSDYTLTNQLLGSFEHKFSSNISGKLDFSYTFDQYSGYLTMDSETKALEDKLLTLAPAIHYQFRDWLTANIAYIYSRRDSSFSSLNYVNNAVVLTALFSM